MYIYATVLCGQDWSTIRRSTAKKFVYHSLRRYINLKALKKIGFLLIDCITVQDYICGVDDFRHDYE